MSEELLECTECSAQCEKVVYPAACLSMNCRFLYAFKEDGDTFFGCIEKVFPHEIDLRMFEDIERGKGGFGVVKVVRTPLPQCSVAVQSCYASGEGPLCRNMYFRRRDRREVQTVEDGIKQACTGLGIVGREDIEMIFHSNAARLITGILARKQKPLPAGQPSSKART